MSCGVSVVLTEVNDTQFPRGRHVQRLAEGALIDGSVSEKAQGDLVRVPDFGGQPTAGRKRNSAADDGGFNDDAVDRLLISMGCGT